MSVADVLCSRSIWRTVSQRSNSNHAKTRNVTHNARVLFIPLSHSRREPQETAKKCCEDREATVLTAIKT